MDHIMIKEELEETHNAVSESYSRRSSNTSNSPPYPVPTSSRISFTPTQRVLPSSLSSRRGAAEGFCGIFPHYSPNANEALKMPPGLKRRGPDIVTSRSKQYRNKQSLSLPLLPTGPSFQLNKPNSKIAVVPGYPQNPQDGGVSQEDEWKNIKVMLNCICGMVEKTQSAISILQQRQADVANVRGAEELVAEVQAKASAAISDVKQAALEEIEKATREKHSEIQNYNKEECCWNCGHPGTETCSGCSLARYCGPFCQHKDWEDHVKVCREDLTMEDISDKQRGSSLVNEREEQ